MDSLGFQMNEMDDKSPWIHLQTWREHLEVLVRASQIGTAATGPTHTAGGQKGEPPAANQISQRWGDSLLQHFMGCHGNCMFSSFPMGSLGRLLLKSVFPTLQILAPTAAFSPFPVHPSTLLQVLWQGSEVDHGTLG